MAILPRGTCPVCGADFALNASGYVRQHRRRLAGDQRGPACPGGDQRPAPADPEEKPE